MRGENVPVIFGLKLRQLREERGLGLKELSELAGISASYVNEIEKGKKYPKADKILQLSEALQVPYDDMVSLKLSKELDSLESFLQSPIIQALPLQMFGLSPQDIIGLISRAPKEVSALIRTLVEIAGSYDMQVEHFLYAMLRSYQESHDNYFEEIELAVVDCKRQRKWMEAPPISSWSLEEVLTGELGIDLDEIDLATYPELNGFRSIWVKGPPARLLINPNLSERQKAFQIGREIGYREMKLKERGSTSSRAEVESFGQVLGDFKASYFAGALLIPEADLVAELKSLFARETWDDRAFLDIMAKYQVTPEMFMYRLTQVIPRHFNLKRLHFLRVNHQSGSNVFKISKQLNISGLPLPAEIGMNEHFCRRWEAVKLVSSLDGLEERGDPEHPLIATQRAHFMNTGAEYFFITLARPLALTPGTNTGVTLGFHMDTPFKKQVRFSGDPAIPSAEVNETCERCSLSASQCSLRAAPPTMVQQKQALKVRKQALEKLMAESAANSTP